MGSSPSSHLKQSSLGSSEIAKHRSTDKKQEDALARFLPTSIRVYLRGLIASVLRCDAAALTRAEHRRALGADQDSVAGLVCQCPCNGLGGAVGGSVARPGKEVAREVLFTTQQTYWSRHHGLPSCQNSEHGASAAGGLTSGTVTAEQTCIWAEGTKVPQFTLPKVRGQPNSLVHRVLFYCCC